MVAVTALQRFAYLGRVDRWCWLRSRLDGNRVRSGTRYLRIEPSRLVLYAVMIRGLLVTLLVKSSPYSLSSFLMLAVLYLPFVAMFKVSVDEYDELNIFQQIMLFWRLPVYYKWPFSLSLRNPTGYST
jgi:hypothetical protein